MKTLPIHLCCIILIATACLTTQCEGKKPSVDLMIEGGGSLVGEQCPGSVKILCHGIDVSILRWRYNGNIHLVTFFSDTLPYLFVSTNNPAFLSVELLSALQDPVEQNFGNFSSELVLDVSQLQTENVTSITCGDPNTFVMIPVDVEIIQQTEPESPNGTNVTAFYEDGSLTDVIISWENLGTRCPEFQSSLIYQVALLGSSVVAVNHTSCGEVCIISFQNFSDAFDEYRVSLFAENAIGISEVLEFPTMIVKQSHVYFVPTLISSDCLFSCECLANTSLNTDSCNVLYTTDSMFMDSFTIVSPLNTQFAITGITSDTIYYFEFTVSVNKTLLVRNRLTERAVSSPRFSTLVIVFLTLTILAIILEAVFGIVLCVLKQLKKFQAKILFLVAGLLGTCSFFLFVFSIITGIQQDPCSMDWSRARKALIISAFLLALIGNILLVYVLLASCQNKKSGTPPAHSPEPSPSSQVDMHRSHPEYQKIKSKRWFWSNTPIEKSQESIKLVALSNTTNSESSALPEFNPPSKYRISAGPIKLFKINDTDTSQGGSASNAQLRVSSAQTDLQQVQISNDTPKNTKVEIVKPPDINEETSDVPLPSETVLIQDAEQEPKYRISAGPIKLFRINDTAPGGGASKSQLGVSSAQTDLQQVGISNDPPKNTKVEIVKPPDINGETSDVPSPSETVLIQDPEQEHKYRISAGPIKLFRINDTAPGGGASKSQLGVSSAQTDLQQVGISNNPPKNIKVEIVKPPDINGETSDVPSPSETVLIQDAEQEPKYRISAGPIKLFRINDTAPGGGASKSQLGVSSAQTDIQQVGISNDPPKNTKVQIAKPPDINEETSDVPSPSETVLIQDAEQEPKFSAGPIKLFRINDTAPGGGESQLGVSSAQTDLHQVEGNDPNASIKEDFLIINEEDIHF